MDRAAVSTTGPQSDASLFFTLPTRLLTGHSRSISYGAGLRSARNSFSVAGASPNHFGQTSGARITGIRLCSGAITSFASVVITVQELIFSPGGERHFPHTPAMTVRPSAQAIAN